MRAYVVITPDCLRDLTAPPTPRQKWKREHRRRRLMARALPRS